MALAMASTAMAAPKDPLVKITGGGTVIYEEYGGLKETYGFNAQQIDAQGNAKGTMQFTWHYTTEPYGVPNHAPNKYIFSANVKYLVYDDETGDVWIGGEVVRSNIATIDYGTGPKTLVGQTFHIRIHDGQFGGKEEDDTIGTTWFCPFGETTHTLEDHVFSKYITRFDENGKVTDDPNGTPETLYPLTNGNITLHYK